MSFSPGRHLRQDSSCRKTLISLSPPAGPISADQSWTTERVRASANLLPVQVAFTGCRSRRRDVGRWISDSGIEPDLPSVAADGFDWTTFHGFLALGFFFGAFG